MKILLLLRARLSRWYGSSLANQLATWSMAVSALAVLGIASASMGIVSGVIEKKELALIQKDVSVASARLSAELNQLLDEFTSLAQNPTVVNGLADGEAATVYLRSTLQSFRLVQTGTVLLQLFDYRGRLLVQSEGVRDESLDQTVLLPLGAQELNAAQFRLVQGRWNLVLAHAIAYPDSNAAQGYLQAFIPVDLILGQWLAPNRDPRTFALRFIQDGQVVITQTFNDPLHSVFREALTLKEPLEQLNIELRMDEERRGTIEALRTLLPIFVVLVALALVTAGWVNWVLGRRLAKPLMNLAERARAIAQTKTFTSALPVSGEDETAQLTRDFNQMLAQLQQLQEELERIAHIRGARLATIFELSPDGFVEMDAQGGIGYLNPAFTKLTGISLTQLASANWVSLAQQLDSQLAQNEPSVRELVLRAQVDMPTAERIVRIHTPSLKSLGVTKRYSADGGVILYWRDLTREAEMQAMKSAFLAKAAHEIRTPLTSILGFAELLGKDQQLAPKQVEMVKIMLRQGRHLLQLIHDLLDLARLEVQTNQWHTQTLQSLCALTQLIVREFQVPSDERQWIFALEEHLPEVRIDANAYRQVLTNLLSNALKYSPPGSPVRLCSRHEESNGVRWQGIAIEDRGMGMSAQELEHLGERFYRANPQGQVAGTGLGISVVQEIMALHDGRLQFESRVGEGTTVTIWFKEDGSNPREAN